VVPTITLPFADSDISAAAAVSWSRRTTRGTDASSDGRCSAANAMITAAMRYSGHTAGRGSDALITRNATAPPRPASHQQISLLRSSRSASAPPYRPNTTSGTSSTAPSRPTATAEPVSCLACTSRATSVA
jgi:hypothetical protein